MHKKRILPYQLEKTHIIIIPKPSKNHLNLVNHRHISLLLTMSKVFQKLILNKLIKYIRPRPE